MKTRKWLLLVLAVLVFNAMTGGVDFSTRAATSIIGDQSVPSAIDCTAASNACPEIAIQGDAPATLPDGRFSPARGYADSSFRRDPASNIIWLAYSWPHTQVSRGAGEGSNTVIVDSHLARSDDNGATWRFMRPLWASTPETDGSGESSYANQETVSLAPRQTPTGTIWYFARLALHSVTANFRAKFPFRPVSATENILTILPWENPVAESHGR
ncbi:exo-alpha-sialidase [Candidatus Acetothermia bacterium]|nr:exo-alpha-sialidase [Candidatus Acetothermia bacterium]